MSKTPVLRRLRAAQTHLDAVLDSYTRDKVLHAALRNACIRDRQSAAWLPIEHMKALTKLYRTKLPAKTEEALYFILQYFNQRIAYYAAHERRIANTGVFDNSRNKQLLEQCDEMEAYIEQYWPDYLGLITTKVDKEGNVYQTDNKTAFDKLFTTFERLM